MHQASKWLFARLACVRLGEFDFRWFLLVVDYYAQLNYVRRIVLATKMTNIVVTLVWPLATRAGWISRPQL